MMMMMMMIRRMPVKPEISD